MQKFDFRHLLPVDFSPSSKVWIYQSNRLFSINESLQIEALLQDFTENWNSHGTKVKGHADLLFGQFILLMADETATGVSGCSTDSSVRLIKHIEKLWNVNLFDRLLLAFVIRDKIQVLPLSQLQYALQNNFIDSGTIYFNNLVQDKNELEQNWMIPVNQSWLSSRLQLT